MDQRLMFRRFAEIDSVMPASFAFNAASDDRHPAADAGVRSQSTLSAVCVE